MLIRVQAGDSPDSAWDLVELQGVVDVALDSKAGLRIGRWSRSDTGKPQLVIGNHELRGEVVNLKRPIAVMEKVTHNDTGDSKTTEYRLVGMVRSKFLFKYRPKMLVESKDASAAKKMRFE